MKHPWTIGLSSAMVLIVVSACATRKQPNGENYYVQATQEYNSHFYQPAIADYQKLIDQYPFSPYAEEAELNIGLAYYKQHDYAEAVGSLTDFMRMHPTSKHLDIASYYLAMAHYVQIGRPDQDQTHTELALKQFQSIEQRFPESDFAALAHEQIEICREMLARHEYLIGDFYYDRANYKASESRMAELMALYPDTPIAPEALYDLARILEKQGKKYSAAQAFTALEQTYPHTKYSSAAANELKRLHQSVDTEEDPLKLVLAESGFGEDRLGAGQVAVHESLANLGKAGADKVYGENGLPNLSAATARETAAAEPSSGSPGHPAKPASEGSNNQVAQADKVQPGPAVLRTVRLSSSDPPLSVVFDLTGPVSFDDDLKNNGDSSTLKVFLKGVSADSQLAHHLVFDRSIFHDCDIDSNSNGTTVTVNTMPVSRFAIVPLERPARLLVTFTPQNVSPSTTASSGVSGNATF
ncbi:MAG: outer membrane protein assembly factor BamD [Deltaproteobacteria bacterium]|nr:outer membrane protein assembly factor BamD [Deltaproteobacteria bacterium]